MNDTLKRYLISSWDTFLTAFVLVLGANLSELDFSSLNSENWDTVLASLLIATLSAALRATFKGIREVTTKQLKS